MHEEIDALQHIVDIGVGADRRPGSPGLNGPAIFRFGDFSADRGRGLFASASPGAFGAVAILETGDPDLHAVATAVGKGHSFGIELFPAVFVIGEGGIGFFLCKFRFAGLHIAINANGRRKEIPGNAGFGGSVSHIDVDENAIAHDLGFRRMDEAHPPHVGGELVNLIKRAGYGLLTIRLFPKVQDHEFIRGSGREFRLFYINAANPIAFLLQFLDEVVGDETARAANQSSFHAILH